MSIEKCKDFEKDGYGTWDDSSKPTTYANMHDFMKNQNNVTLALANGLWQPSTAYSVGAVVHSPSLPAGCKATCTTAGTTGSTEPEWTAYGTTVTDGTVKWKVETDVQSIITKEVQTAIKTAILAVFPVGTIIETTNSANPSTYIGGTWEQLPGGYTTVSAGTYSETHDVNGTNVTDTYVFTAGSSEFTVNGTKTRGEAKHKISEGELPHITGSVWNFARQDPNQNITTSGVFSSPHSMEGVGSGTDAQSPLPDGFDLNFGNNQPHNNMAPSYGVFRFRRTI